MRIYISMSFQNILEIISCSLKLLENTIIYCNKGIRDNFPHLWNQNNIQVSQKRCKNIRHPKRYSEKLNNPNSTIHRW